MPAKPPPLPFASTSAPPWWASPPTADLRRPSSINWSAILASSSLAFALVVSVVAWIIAHPNKAAVSAAAPNVASLAPGVKFTSQATIEPADLPPAPPALHPASVPETIPAAYQSARQDRIARHIPQMEETPPPLSPPAPSRPRCAAPPAAAQPATPQLAGETYGTQVLFLNNQETAAELAKRNHKLLFVMHISGNFEDSCFT